MTRSIRIILTEDGGTLHGWPTPPTRQTIEDHVNRYAGQGIDVLAYGLVGAHLATYQSKAFYRQWLDEPDDDSQTAKNARAMAESGIDFPAVVAEACHRNGLLFWPTVRMNSTARSHSTAHDEHPHWFFDGYAAMYGFREGYRPMMNYEIAEVREFMLRGLRELVEDYDADGLQLDFTRYPSIFLLERARANTDMFTRYMGVVRRMLDEVGEGKGRRLTLAVQVPCHQWQAHTYGHDVNAWVEERIVDYLLPTQPNNIDCNLPVEQWVETVANTDCRVFPTLHPYFRFPWTAESRADLSSLRAAAHLYYGQGAHGLSTVNMFDALQNDWFNELRDPDCVEKGPHHYRYTFDANGSTNLSLKLDHLLWRVSTPIRIVDDPEKMRGGKLVLTIENLGDESRLDILLNGKLIPRLQRQGRSRYARFPSSRENTSVIEIPLSQLDLRLGQNHLAFSYNVPVPPGTWLHVREVELVLGDSQ